MTFRYFFVLRLGNHQILHYYIEMNGLLRTNPMLRSILISTFFFACHAFGASIIVVQPISVCNDAGGDCSNSAGQYFEAETDKIWNQADIDISFLPLTEFHNSSFQSINSNTDFVSLVNTPGHGQHATSTVLNMWFLKEIDSGTVSGLGFLGANGVAIADSIFTFADGAGRRDTIAHEIGHNLNLDHTNESNLRLMAPGSLRLKPTNTLNIFPDGVGVSQLTAAEIATAQSSPLVVPVPEPASYAALALIGCLLVVVRRRFQGVAISM